MNAALANYFKPPVLRRRCLAQPHDQASGTLIVRPSANWATGVFRYFQRNN